MVNKNYMGKKDIYLFLMFVYIEYMFNIFFVNDSFMFINYFDSFVLIGNNYLIVKMRR